MYSCYLKSSENTFDHLDQTGVLDGCEPPCGPWEPNPDFANPQVIFTTELSLTRLYIKLSGFSY